VNRVELEVKLNEGRNWLLMKYNGLSDDELRRPLTQSEHDPENQWSALDHLAHMALVERNFNAMVRRHFQGSANPVGLLNDDEGQPRSRAEIMKLVHAQTEAWQREHHDETFNEVVALTAAQRSETLQLISELRDAQLEETLPGAPWDDGTVGGVLGANADHGHMHWKWVTDAGLVEVAADSQ
jgi:DinB family protein